MCYAKKDGGKRCFPHALRDMVAALVSPRATKESVTTKAENLLVSPVGKTYFEDKGQELVSVGASQAESANTNTAFLKAAKFHQKDLAPVVATKKEFPEMDYMSNSEKMEYSKFVSDEQRKDWWDKKEKEDKAILEESAKEWRNDPSSYYDRLSMPSEHAHLATKKDMPPEYLAIIASSTMDKNVRRNAIRNYASQKGVSVEVAEASLGMSAYEIEKERKDYLAERESEKEYEVERVNNLKAKAIEDKRKKKASKPSALKRMFVFLKKKYW